MLFSKAVICFFVCIYKIKHLLMFAQRLQFDVTSPNGILLFREASKIINCYGGHILTLSDIPDDKLYSLKYPLMNTLALLVNIVIYI